MTPLSQSPMESLPAIDRLQAIVAEFPMELLDKLRQYGQVAGPKKLAIWETVEIVNDQLKQLAQHYPLHQLREYQHYRDVFDRTRYFLRSRFEYRMNEAAELATGGKWVDARELLLEVEGIARHTDIVSPYELVQYDDQYYEVEERAREADRKQRAAEKERKRRLQEQARAAATGDPERTEHIVEPVRQVGGRSIPTTVVLDRKRTDGAVDAVAPMEEATAEVEPEPIVLLDAEVMVARVAEVLKGMSAKDSLDQLLKRLLRLSEVCASYPEVHWHQALAAKRPLRVFLQKVLEVAVKVGRSPRFGSEEDRFSYVTTLAQIFQRLAPIVRALSEGSENAADMLIGVIREFQSADSKVFTPEEVAPVVSRLQPLIADAPFTLDPSEEQLDRALLVRMQRHGRLFFNHLRNRWQGWRSE